MEKKLIINCDGGSRGNPGPAASAFVASINDNAIHKESKFLGITTNNDAEYSAVILALRWLKLQTLKVTEIFFVLDSELVARQINGIYKIKNAKLKERYLEIIDLIKTINLKINFQNVSREKNKIADALVNEELDKQNFS